MLFCGIKVQKFIIKNGSKISATDTALFIRHENEDLIDIICVHLFTYKYVHIQNVIFKLCKTFSIWKEKNNLSTYLGLNISKNKNNYVTIKKAITLIN